MGVRSFLLLLPWCCVPGHIAAQAPAQPQAAVTQETREQLSEQGQKLLAEARQSASGSAGMKLASYPGHFTLLTARVKSGGAEMHMRFNDIFVVLDGDATEVTGGTLIDRIEGAPGEFHGSRVEGGERHAMERHAMHRHAMHQGMWCTSRTGWLTRRWWSLATTSCTT